MKTLLSYFLFFLSLILLTEFAASREIGKATVDSSSLRLPKALKPVHYLIRLQPFLSGNFSIEGLVEITFNVLEPTDHIILHMVDIITKNETLKVYKNDTPEVNLGVVSQSFDNVRQFYKVKLDQELEAGQAYTMHLEFTGYLNDDLRGFYRSTYKDDDGNEVILAATQFEATDARRAFPCFDEPALKANFTIEIAREEGLRAISNMPRKEEVPYEGKPGWFWDKFATTLPMSTYLVAFIVSDFAYREAEKEPGTDYYFRVWARENSIDHSDYALAVGPKVSRFYENFFNVSFPLPKQDMVALPDFSSGAMENWGIITFREERILMDPEKITAAARFMGAETIAHELAHMWFGDLVTMAWWNDIWLNEGFATYMEYIGVNNFDNSMKALEQFITNAVHVALRLDALDSSHPISQEVSNPDEITELFDDISYSKGGSLLHMINSVLTENTFKKGLSNYLTELSFKNAAQDDLWRYLTEQAHRDGTLSPKVTVKEIMDTWTLQKGYPVITVKRQEDGTIVVSQERFLVEKDSTSGGVRDDSQYHYRWWVPLSYTTSSKMNFSHTHPQEWLSITEDLKTLQNVAVDQDAWILFNVGQTGYYRVNYDEQNWEAIRQQLVEDHTNIGVINRAQIIDDVFNLAKAGLVDYKVSMGILDYIKKETEFVPFKSALNSIAYIRKMFSQLPMEEKLNEHLRNLIEPVYKYVGFEDSLSDPHTKQRIRSEVVEIACKIGYEPCVESSQDLYAKWMADPSDDSIISPNVKSTVMCTAIEAGGDNEWDFAWKQYQAANLASEKNLFLKALGCSKDVERLKDYLQNSITAGVGIRKQDAVKVLEAVAETKVGRVLAWDFVRNNWRHIIRYFGSTPFGISKLVSGATDNLNTREQLSQSKAFLTDYEGELSSAARTARQAVEKIQSNVNWMEKYSDIIGQWVEEALSKQA